MKAIDKAGTAYWDENWSKMNFPIPFDPTDDRLDNFVSLSLHQYFQEILKDKKGFSVLEIGCANSIWPLYFHKYFDARLFGLDYSEVGCEKSRALLKYHNIPGEIYCADLFSPPKDLLGKFDLVVSFGVVEHFENTADCLNACAAFVKPNGQLFTLIPNMSGVVGSLQKYVDREVYDVHVSVSKEKFSAAHTHANLKLQACDYFMFINLSVVNSGKFSTHPLNKYFRHSLSAISKIFWMFGRLGLKLPSNKFTSPYLLALATKNHTRIN